MSSTRKSKSRVSSPSLKQSTLFFPSTKRSNSAQASAKGKKSARSGSVPTGQIKGQLSVVLRNAGDISESSSEDEKISRVKRRKIDESRAKGEMKGDGPGEEVILKRRTLNHNDPRWSNIYSDARAKMGDLPPVHCVGQSKVNHILRVFDLSYEYGPCIGVTRLQRWERAEALGLNPPAEVYEILTTEEGSEETDLKECVFYDNV